jgi:23S rRNA pseudoU1915 N3-methylase RlmH
MIDNFHHFGMKCKKVFLLLLVFYALAGTPRGTSLSNSQSDFSKYNPVYRAAMYFTARYYKSFRPGTDSHRNNWIKKQVDKFFADVEQKLNELEIKNNTLDQELSRWTGKNISEEREIFRKPVKEIQKQTEDLYELISRVQMIAANKKAFEFSRTHTKENIVFLVGGLQGFVETAGQDIRNFLDLKREDSGYKVDIQALNQNPLANLIRAQLTAELILELLDQK